MPTQEISWRPKADLEQAKTAFNKDKNAQKRAVTPRMGPCILGHGAAGGRSSAVARVHILGGGSRRISGRADLHCIVYWICRDKWAGLREANQVALNVRIW